MAMENDSELFAKADQQVSALKERIARQREEIKRAKLTGHSTAAAEAAQQALEGTLRVFEKRRRQVFERLQRHELATPLHSITSSAIASTPGGMVRPSALAVLRLMTNWNLVGCSIGRSAGFAPLRTLTTNVAARRLTSVMFGP